MRSPFFYPIRLRGRPYLCSPVIGKKNNVIPFPGRGGIPCRTGGKSSPRESDSFSSQSYRYIYIKLRPVTRQPVRNAPEIQGLSRTGRMDAGEYYPPQYQLRLLTSNRKTSTESLQILLPGSGGVS